jgi:hypothetical protein
VPRDTALARALFATDELCGFLVACALVRPTRSLDDLEVSSVKKKLKDKAFARTVNRDDIRQGVEELGVGLDEHVRFVIDALRPVQHVIGLKGSDEQEPGGGEQGAGDGRRGTEDTAAAAQETPTTRQENPNPDS